MENPELFEIMRRIYNIHATAGALDFSSVAMMVQTSGKNDPTYSLGVACAFKALAGDNWDVFCDIYNTTNKKSDEQLKVCKGILRLFWNSVKRSGKYSEFIRIAYRYKMTKEAA